jgi:hypothetical protein
VEVTVLICVSPCLQARAGGGGGPKSGHAETRLRHKVVRYSQTAGVMQLLQFVTHALHVMWFTWRQGRGCCSHPNVNQRCPQLLQLSPTQFTGKHHHLTASNQIP